MSLPAAILAGGLGTRLGSLTAQTPKVLMEVAGQPFILHQLALLRRNGIERVVLCIGHLGEQVQAVVGDGAALGLHVTYSFDGPKLLGTGGALRQALPLLGDAFFVLYGDSYLDCDYQAAARAFHASHRLGLMTVFRNAGQWDTSNIIYRAGEIVRYDKRERVPEMEYIDYGLGLLRAEAFAAAPSDPLDLAHLYQALLAQGQLAAHEVTQRFYEIGSPAGLAETDAYLRHPVDSH